MKNLCFAVFAIRNLWNPEEKGQAYSIVGTRTDLLTRENEY
jgi:hypothetical protein